MAWRASQTFRCACFLPETSCYTAMHSRTALIVQSHSLDLAPRARLLLLPATQEHHSTVGAYAAGKRWLHALAQELRMYDVAGPDGSFLAAASPTLRSLQMDGLPDFKVRVWEGVGPGTLGAAALTLLL